MKTRMYSRTNNEVVGLWSASLSPLAEQLCWFALVVLHIICSAYYATISWCYWRLQGTLLDNWLNFYRLGLGSEHYHTVVVVHGFFAGIHVFYLVWMIGWSIKKQNLVLAVYKAPRRRNQSHLSVINRCRAFYSKFGVNGPYFDLILLFREIVETALQTNQAYRMGRLLSRDSLNRAYVSLLVLNCWSTSIVHYVFHSKTASRRLWALICDCILDLVTSVGITSVLLVVYSSEFIIEQDGYASYKWYDEVWIVHVVSEFQILMVPSWGDFAMRVIFAFSMITNMTNMKNLLTAEKASSSKTLRSAKSMTNHGISSIVPLTPTTADLKLAYRRNKFHVSWFSQILFFAWGILILGLHLYAESIPTFSQCKMQVKPWFSSKSSCSFLVINCYKSKISGMEDEIDALWSPFDPTTISSLVIRHCSRLEIPSKLTEFSGLKYLKVYNSTILNWQEDAAISQVHHPSLLMLFLVRVNMTNCELPAGLYRDQLPITLRDIEICMTNMRTLPDDLDLTWPHFATIYIEASNLTDVPPSLVRLAPFDFSLALNPISSIPASMIEGNAGYLHVGGTLISDLPEVVHDASPYFKIRLDNTNVSFFWEWIDPMVENADSSIADGIPIILATNSPYCLDLQHIYDGEQPSFSTPMHKGQSKLLSDASVENWLTLQKAVVCDEWPATYYPIEFEEECRIGSIEQSLATGFWW